MTTATKVSRTSFLLLLLLGFSSIVQAQGISGVVKDSQGGVLPGVSITVLNVDTGISRTIVTGSAGRFEAPSLQPGRYEVRASLEGFQTVARSGVVLTVGRDEAVDFTMDLGAFEQEVVVSGTTSLVDTTSATVSGLVDERAIRDLPLVSRSFDELITLHAGTSVIRAASQGFANAFSVAGQRAGSTKFYQDGTELQGSTREQEFVGSAAGVLLGVESIKEFRVLTSTYSPEFGKKAGGVVLTVTKSGTNTVHGSLLEFYRNSALDAANYFAVGEKDPFERNHFGGSVGGPIARNRSFFFANYEGLRETLSTPFEALVPDVNARQGLLPDGVGNLVNVGVHPKIAPYLAMWPLPNTAQNFGDGRGVYEHAPARTTREHFFLGRIDHTLSPAQSIFGSYSFSDAGVFDPNENPFFGTNIDSRDQRATIEHKYLVSSQMVNVLRFGFSRSFHAIDVQPVVDLNPAMVPFATGQPLGSLGVTGLADTGGTQGDTFGQKSSYQLSNQVTYSAGRHSLEFGGQIHRTQMNEDAVDRKRGQWDFAGLPELLTLRVRRFRGALPEGATGTLSIGLPVEPNPLKAWRQTYLGLYIRDRIAWNRVTLDLGLRYELMTSPTEANGRTSNFPLLEERPPFARIVSTEAVIGEKIWPTDYGKGFAPRLGVSWDPFGTGRTVVRGGFGVFYDQVDNNFRFFTHINPPFSTRVETTSAAAFPNPFVVIPFSQYTLTGRSIDPNIEAAEIRHYTVGVQQQLWSGTVLSVGYVGASGSNLERLVEVNVRIPELVGGELYWAPNAPVAQPLFGQWDFLYSNGSSSYHALQAEFESRFGHEGFFRRLRSKVSYTYSKSMDDGSILQGGGGANSFNRPVDQFDLEREWAVSAHDLAHRLTVNFTYDLTDLPLQGLASSLFNNWQLNGIATLTSGSPIYLSTGFSRSRNGQGFVADRPSLIDGGNSNPVLGGSERYYDPFQFVLPSVGTLGNLGRHTLIGPGFATVDFSLSKVIPVSGRFRVQLRLEVFNLLNRANLGVPSKNVFNSQGNVQATAGRITNTAAPNRQVQLGVKLEL